MPVFTYQGLSQEEKDHLFEEQSKSIRPMDMPGEEAKYAIDIRDPEFIKEEKRANTKVYVDKRKEELRASLDADDASRSLGGFTFPKGQPVTVPDGEVVIAKLKKLVKLGVFSSGGKVAVEVSTEEQEEQEEPKRRGRKPKPKGD